MDSREVVRKLVYESQDRVDMTAVSPVLLEAAEALTSLELNEGVCSWLNSIKFGWMDEDLAVHIDGATIDLLAEHGFTELSELAEAVSVEQATKALSGLFNALGRPIEQLWPGPTDAMEAWTLDTLLQEKGVPSKYPWASQFAKWLIDPQVHGAATRDKRITPKQLALYLVKSGLLSQAAPAQQQPVQTDPGTQVSWMALDWVTKNYPKNQWARQDVFDWIRKMLGRQDIWVKTGDPNEIAVIQGKPITYDRLAGAIGGRVTGEELKRRVRTAMTRGMPGQ